MLLDPLNIERTEWKTKNLMSLFEKTLSLFPQLEEEDIKEIKNHIQSHNVDYLEVAHYEKAFEDQKDPSAILVINNNRVFYDIVDLNRKDTLVENFKQLTIDSVQFVKSRKITKNELKKRVQALVEMNSGSLKNTELLTEDHDFEDYYTEEENYIEKDESGILDRTAIHIIAKKPVLDWLNDCLKKEPRRAIPMGEFEWTLEKINHEPHVFLIPIGTELLPKKEALRFWRETKEKIFMEILESYYIDEDYWPSYSGEAHFDQWFDIKKLGLVIDLVEE